MGMIAFNILSDKLTLAVGIHEGLIGLWLDIGINILSRFVKVYMQFLVVLVVSNGLDGGTLYWDMFCHGAANGLLAAPIAAAGLGGDCASAC